MQPADKRIALVSDVNAVNARVDDVEANGPGDIGEAVNTAISEGGSANGTIAAIADDSATSVVNNTGWIDSYTRQAMSPPEPFDVPTIIYTVGTDTALTSPVEKKVKGLGGGAKIAGWAGQDDPTFLFGPGSYESSNGAKQDLAMYGEKKPGGIQQAATWPMMISFDTSAQTIEAFFYSKVANSQIMVRVDGRWISDQYLVRTVSGNAFTATITFPVGRSRTVELIGTGDMGLIGVRVPAGQTITKPSAPIKRRIAVVGDSYVNGAGTSGSKLGAGAGNMETFAPRLAQLLGADQMMLAGIGGSGWVAGTDNGTPNPYSTRLTAVLNANPDVIVFYGSINDGAAGVGVRDAVEAALARCTGVPEVYVIGPLLSGYSVNNAEVKAGTLAAGRTFIDMGDFIYGTGRTDAPAGDGNKDFYIRSDGAHPTFLAHKAIADAIFRRIATRNM